MISYYLEILQRFKMIHRSVKYLKLSISISIRNVNEEEQVALWREGRRREPMPVEIDF